MLKPSSHKPKEHSIYRVYDNVWKFLLYRGPLALLLSTHRRIVVGDELKLPLHCAR